MTEQGEQWLAKTLNRTEPLLYVRDDADKLLRAFVAFVNERAKDKTNCTNLYMAFNDVVRELLGE